MTGPKLTELYADKAMVKTSGEIFSDGSILDLVRVPSGEINFLIWDSKSAKTAPEFVRDGECHVPLRIDPTILRSLRLPSNIANYDSTRKLFNNISDLISQVTRAR